MPKIVELRPQRHFISNNFEGYKLSLEPVPIIRQTINVQPPKKAEPNNEQYSFLHAMLFSTQNLLETDPWERNDAYFVNQIGEIMRSSYNENSGRPATLYKVSSITSEDDREFGDYNYSIRFISEKYCVACDGINTLFLYDTGDRRKAIEWKTVAKTKIIIKLKNNGEDVLIDRNFIIQDARLDTIMEHKQISIALGHIERIDGQGDSNMGSQHYMQIHWMQWKFEEGNWTFKWLEMLQGKGSIYYCAFEPRAESLVVCSNHDISFHTPTKQIVKPKNATNIFKWSKTVCENGKEVDNFVWSQTDEDVVIKFLNCPENANSKGFDIKCTTNHMLVKYTEEELLNSELFADIDEDLTTWSVENKVLQITLIKRQNGLNWTALCSDGTGPPETIDKDVQNAPLTGEQQPIINLEAPIEDCDFPMGQLCEDDVKIERFNLLTKSVTHTILLGTNAPLFSTILRPGFPRAIAIRQDVDAALYLQQYNASKPEDWYCRHEGNLHAFGYVQASKQQKKFMDCAPDLSYAIICESTRHIFLYKSKYEEANGLRNRNGPQVFFGKQHLITLAETNEILGVSTACSIITILTDKQLLYLQIAC